MDDEILLFIREIFYFSVTYLNLQKVRDASLLNVTIRLYFEEFQLIRMPEKIKNACFAFLKIEIMKKNCVNC